MRIDGYPLIRVFKCFCFLDCTRTGLVLKKRIPGARRGPEIHYVSAFILYWQRLTSRLRRL